MSVRRRFLAVWHIVTLGVAAVCVAASPAAEGETCGRFPCVLVFPGLLQADDDWSHFASVASSQGLVVEVAEFPSEDGYYGVKGHAVNHKVFEERINDLLMRLGPEEHFSIVLYSQSTPNFMSFVLALDEPKRATFLDKLEGVVVLDPALKQSDLWPLKTAPLSKMLSIVKMGGGEYTSFTELLEKDGNTYLQDVRDRYAEVGQLMAQADVTWSILPFQSGVVRATEARTLARALRDAGVRVRVTEPVDLFPKDGEVFTRLPHNVFYTKKDPRKHPLSGMITIENSVFRYVVNELRRDGDEGDETGHLGGSLPDGPGRTGRRTGRTARAT